MPNQEIWDLWEKFQRQINGRMPLFYQPIQENSLLFIGLNPSFNIDKINKLLHDKNLEEINENYFTFPMDNNLDRDEFISRSCQLDQYAREDYPYFSKFKELSGEVCISWDHVDLFFIRETSQDELKKIVGIKFDKENNLLLDKLNDFGSEQLELSKKIIKQTKPKLIVVANALASRIFKQVYKPEFDNTNGWYFVKLNDDYDRVPLFLSSMLTGQRALDSFSFERLKWHIKKAIAQ